LSISCRPNLRTTCRLVKQWILSNSSNSPNTPWRSETAIVRDFTTVRFSAVSCTKTDEPIDLPFGLRTSLGWRMHKFNRIHQVAPICPTTLFRELCKNGSTDRFAVNWVYGFGWAKEAQTNSFSPLLSSNCSFCNSNSSHGRAHSRHLENTIEPFVCGSDIPYAKLLWPLVIFGHAHSDSLTDSRALRAEYCIVGILQNTVTHDSYSLLCNVT